MEKVWGFVQDNHLDRERVMMTNVILSAELCLKAIMTHATFKETGYFKFSGGHDVVKLFEDLPDTLRDGITTESNVFAKEYVAFRTQIEEEIKEISDRRFSQTKQEVHAEWDQIAERIRESPYTAFVNSNDPCQGRWDLGPLGRSKSVPAERSLASVNVRASCRGEVSQRQASCRLVGE